MCIKIYQMWLDLCWVWLDLINFSNCMRWGTFLFSKLLVYELFGFRGCCWKSFQHTHKFLSISSNPTFMRSPGAGMHTKRSASTSWYKKRIQFVFMRKNVELSTEPFENLLFWNCWKTAHVFLYHNKMNYISRPGEPSARSWGNPARRPASTHY